MAFKTVTEGNRIRWDGKLKPFYEAYYLKLVDPARRWSFWCRYTLVSPESAGQAAVANLWGIFQAADGRHIALKSGMSLAEMDIFHCDSFIQLGQNQLTLSDAKGTLSDENHLLDWNFEFEDPTVSTHLYPYSILYKLPFPKTKFVEPRLTTHVSGTLTVGHEQFTLRHCPAHQGHLWGSAYANRWTWGHCNLFQEDPTAVFEGLVAEVPLGPRSSPPLAMFHFIYEGQTYKATSPLKWLRNQSHQSLLEWRFTAVCGKTKFEGILSRVPELTVGLAYEGPNGESRFCHNTMMADMELNVFEKKGGRWAFQKRLTSPAGAAFETVEPAPDSRVHFVL